MGLKDAIGKLLGRRSNIDELTNTPFRKECWWGIHHHLDHSQLRENLRPEALEHLADWLWQQCLEIEADSNPRGRCRYALVDQTIARSKFEVLVMQPNQDNDVTGFVGTQGITGKLHAHIDEIFRADEKLRDLTGLPLADVEWRMANDAALLMMRKSYWISSVFNTARIALDDQATDEDRDWYKPFFHSACVASEYFTRMKVGMPNAIQNDEDGTIAQAYSSFMEFVLMEETHPLQAWRNHYRAAIRDGHLTPPFGID